MSPGEGVVSILLEGRLIGGRLLEGDCANKVRTLIKKPIEKRPIGRITTPPLRDRWKERETSVMQSGRDGQRNLKLAEPRNFVCEAGAGSQEYNEVLNAADGDVATKVATTSGQRPDSCDVGE
jgi:hypothetical protein